jgi:hypothetical protein
MTTQSVASQVEKFEQKPFIAFTRTVQPAQMEDTGRGALFQEMLALNQRIFEGPGIQAVTEVIAKGLQGRTTVQLYFNAQHQCVGYAALLGDEFEHEGKPWTVFRAMTGLLPEYRGRQSVLGFYLSELTAYALRNPSRRVFFFTPVVHISSYRVLARHAREMYPMPGRPVPAGVMELMQRLGARYNLAPIEGEHPLVRRRQLWVRGSQGRSGATGDAFDQFFRAINPRSGEGLCVMTLAPISIGQVSFGAARYAWTRASVLVRGLWSRWTEGLSLPAK